MQKNRWAATAQPLDLRTWLGRLQRSRFRGPLADDGDGAPCPSTPTLLLTTATIASSTRGSSFGPCILSDLDAYAHEHYMYVLSTSRLDVRPSQLVSVGERSFSPAGPRLWNSLPEDVHSASSLAIFLRQLKLYLFKQSYPYIILAFCSCIATMDLEVTLVRVL